MGVWGGLGKGYNWTDPFLLIREAVAGLRAESDLIRPLVFRREAGGGSDLKPAT